MNQTKSLAVFETIAESLHCLFKVWQKYSASYDFTRMEGSNMDIIDFEIILIVDQLVRLAEIPVNEIKEPPIIFSRGEKKVISRDSKSSAATQLEILSAGKNIIGKIMYKYVVVYLVLKIFM